MTPLGRIIIGAFAALIFGGIGGTLLLEERYVIGSVLFGLGVLRVAVLIRQVARYMAKNQEEED